MAKSLNISGSTFHDKVSININNEETPIKNITLNWTAAASCFKGRSDTFTEIQQKFTTNKIIVLHGMPGIGKTETARNFANRNSEYYNGNLIWIYAETPENIKKCFDNLAQTLNLKTMDVSQIYTKFKTSKALFILDNAENMFSIKKFLPSSQVQPSIDILITIRLSTWDSAISKIPLDSLKIENALDIFNTKLGDKFQEYPNEIWTKLVTQLDGIPLCLQIISSLIYEQVCEFRLTKFNLEEFFNEIKETFIHSTIPETEQNYYNKTVLSAIYSALNQLKKEEAQLSIDLLCFIAYLDADQIEDDDLLQFSSMKKSKSLLEKALRKLVNYTLIHVTNSSWGTEVKVHRTVQLVVRKYDLREKNGQILKSVLQSLLPIGFVIDDPPDHPNYNHLHSFFNCVRKTEYQPIAMEICKEDNVLFYKFVLHLAYFHCEEILDKLFPLIKDDIKDSKKYTSVINKMLYWAVSNKHTDLNTINLLIKHGAAIKNAEDLIRDAAYWLSIDILDIALHLNARDHLLPEDDFKGLLLHNTVYRSSENLKKAIDCINYLTDKKNANIFYKDKQLNNILHSACNRGYYLKFEILKYLIEKFNLKNLANSQNEWQQTPLQVFFKKTTNCPFPEVLIQFFSYFIIECKADITIRNAKGWNILFDICYEGSFELIEWFLNNSDCSKIINNQDCEGNVAFTYLILSKKVEEREKILLVECFDQNKMNFNVINNDNEHLYEIGLKKELTELSDVLKMRCEDRVSVS